MRQLHVRHTYIYIKLNVSLISRYFYVCNIHWPYIHFTKTSDTIVDSLLSTVSQKIAYLRSTFEIPVSPNQPDNFHLGSFYVKVFRFRHRAI